MVTTTKYLWDDDNIIAEADETDTIHTVHTYEPQPYGNLISTRIGNATSYHHFDATGSTRQLTNSAGAVTDRMTYDAWGNVVSRTGTTPIAMLWIGELGYYYDVETGLFSVRERPYEPENGRWTTVDPLEFIDGLNRYLFVSNTPPLIVDPSGFAGCVPNPVNAQFIDNRGTFTDIRLLGFDGKKKGNLYSGFAATWNPNGGSTWNPTGNCSCCDKIGFVQIVWTNWKYISWFFGPSEETENWHVDASIPYPIARSSAPDITVNPSIPGSKIGISDSPNVSSKTSFRTTTSYSFDAETCVVCLSGTEGPQYKVTTTPVSVIKTLLGIGVYGCVNWTVRWTLNQPRAGSYGVYRTLNGERHPSSGYVSQASDLAGESGPGTAGFLVGSYQGAAPSDAFWETVKNYLSTVSSPGVII